MPVCIIGRVSFMGGRIVRRRIDKTEIYIPDEKSNSYAVI